MPTTPVCLPFVAVPADGLALVGGKGLSLGHVRRAGLPVPPGFCVTTAAYTAFVAQVPGFAAAQARLQALSAADAPAIRAAAAAMRALLLQTPLPNALQHAVRDALEAAAGPDGAHAVAVRSSATLEDLPDASFAGQHDSHLGVRGAPAVFDALRACWASLFTARAVAYRRRQGLDETDAAMAVVVQRMAAPDVAGVLFTADPVSGNRALCIIDAAYGLGESVVSGVVNPDHIHARKADGDVVAYHVGDKATALQMAPQHETQHGGTVERAVSPDAQAARALTDAQVAELVALGRALEDVYGAPQDVEWAIEDGEVQILQSRPITSLFPLPAQPPDATRTAGTRVYVCAGHQQANPAAWSPLGVSVFQRAFAMGRGPGPAVEAGHRLYVDVTALLRTWPFRALLPRLMMAVSPAIGARMLAVRDRPEVAASPARLPRTRMFGLAARVVPRVLYKLLLARPAAARGAWETFMARERTRIAEAMGEHVPLDVALDAAATEAGAIVHRVMLPMALPNLLPAVLAGKALERLMKGRVDDAVHTALASGLAGNIVTAMDEALAALACTAHTRPAVARAIHAGDVAAVETWRAAADETWRAQWDAFMTRFGHRGAGEVDVAKPRWRDDPRGVLHTLSGIIRGLDAGGPDATQAAHGHTARITAARQASQAAEDTVLREARRGPMGWLRRAAATWCIRRIRGYGALREHHKYWVVWVLGALRDVVWRAGEAAVSQGHLEHTDDVFYLTLDEVRAMHAGTGGPWRERVQTRRADHARYAAMAPPALMLSTGEVPAIPRKGGPLPDGTYAGVPVSAGSIEGIARVLRDPSEAVLAPGEILVAPFTDAAWTTLFVHAGAVVLEAGGAMSHGSVIAREYGIPAVVGLAGATTHIQSGQRIRVDGAAGLVTVLPEAPALPLAPGTPDGP